MISGPATTFAAVDARPTLSPRIDYPDFQQMANLQAGDAPVYAPGFSLNITRHPPEVTLCPGPIEIPRH